LCGIAGFTHKNWRPGAERIRDAAYSLVHRGPDQQGVWESDLVSLGAARLKIIDLSGGDQPMVSGDGDAVMVFNGEIYNHPELRRELEGLGHRFHSRSDTEVALHAFFEWDLDCFRRLRGMFAAALWQQSRRRLVLARDRMGIKPLYIHRRGEDLYFGSELKAILEHPEIERRIDRTGLAYYLSLNYVPCPYTLVEGIRKLAPGHWMEWRDGAVTTGAYWRLQFAPRERPLAEAKEELDYLLRESVREHLISDVPLGVWASGGIDSSAILHYAAQASPARLKTFSVSFRGRSFDESPYFREVARAYQTDHHEFDLNPERDLEDAIGELAYYSDEPGADAGALPVWYLSKMCRSQVTVALSGEGADELFGGYTTYLADSLVRPLRRVPAFLRRGALKALELWPVSDDKISFEYKLKRFLAGSLLDPAAAHLFWNGTFSETDREYLLAFDGHPPLASLTRSLGEDAGRLDDLSRFLWTDQRYYLPDDILYKCDRMSMAHSLEVRPPFLDHRIVEFAASLPIHLKVRGSKLKFLLKELMRDKLPPAILARRKEGFDIPAHDWLRGGLRSLLLETLTPEAVRRTGLFRAEAVEQAIRVHLDRRANLGYHLWGLLVLFLWMKRWGIETLAPERQSSARTEGFASATN
jgi:asparagine synthase (glutamine-hydrolysing)